MGLPRRVSDLRAFELLESVAASGSIGRCARQFGLSQPSVSARLRALESAVGATLLHRHPHGARLTPAGEQVLHWARPALEAAATLEANLAALRVDAHRQLAIAASTTIAECLLPGWLDELQARHGRLQVTLRGHNSADTITLVRRAAVELGFAEAGHIPPDLDHRPVLTDRLVVCVAPSHPWAATRQVSPSQLADAPLITREPGSGTRWVLEEHLAALREPQAFQPLLELSSTSAVKNAAIRGLGPAVLSSLALVSELATGTLVEIDVPGLRLRRDLHAVWRAGHRFSPAARDLLGIARAHAG